MNQLSWKHELIKLNLNQPDPLEKSRRVALLDAIIILSVQRGTLVCKGHRTIKHANLNLHLR